MRGRTIDQANSDARKRARSVQATTTKKNQLQQEQSPPAPIIGGAGVVGAFAVGYLVGQSSQALIVANPIEPGGRDLGRDCGL